MIQFTPRRRVGGGQVIRAVNTAVKYAPYARALWNTGKAVKRYWDGRAKKPGKGKTVVLRSTGAVGQKTISKGKRGRGRVSLRKKINRLAKKCKVSYHTYRITVGGGCTSAENVWAEKSAIAWNRAYLVTSMTQIPEIVYNGTNQLNGLDRTATSNRVNFKADASCYSNLEIRNNGLTEVEVWVYTVECVQNTADSPTTVLANLYADTYYGAAAATNMGVYPSEVQGYQRYYKIIKTNKFGMNPGDTAKLSTRQFIKGLDPKQLSQVTVAAAAHRTRYFFVRARGGVAGLAATADQAGRAAVTLDMIATTNIRLCFDGIGTRTVSIDQTGLGAVDQQVSINDPAQETT